MGRTSPGPRTCRKKNFLHSILHFRPAERCCCNITDSTIACTGKAVSALLHINLTNLSTHQAFTKFFLGVILYGQGATLLRWFHLNRRWPAESVALWVLCDNRNTAIKCTENIHIVIDCFHCNGKYAVCSAMHCTVHINYIPVWSKVTGWNSSPVQA